MNKVKEKILYSITVSCCSPLAVSNGNDGITDNDVLRDYDGHPFVPGSSLAGVFRNYFGWMKDQECLFGYTSSGGQEGKMSSLFISDLCFSETDVPTAVRNGVELGKNKTALSQKKYDFEVVDTGAEGRFMIELIIREEDEKEKYRQQILQVLSALHRHEIRIGAKTTRGFGEFDILSLKERVFDKKNILDYKDAYEEVNPESWTDITESLMQVGLEKKYITIRVPLKLKGGISIRQYSAQKGLPDYVHQTVRGKGERIHCSDDNYDGIPVIPGTSIGGAIRHRMSEILETLHIPETERIMNTVFGYVEGKNAHISNVRFDECMIRGAHPLRTTRTAISRFESAVKETALYQELAYFEGETEISIQVSKNITMNNENGELVDVTGYIIGFLLIVVRDIQNGYLSIGGETAIGRGLLSANGEVTIDGNREDTEQYIRNCIKIREELV